MGKSTRNGAVSKPAKPHKDFPLYPHATKRWAKKIKGKTLFFGPWADPQAALAEYLRTKDDHLAGRKPRPAGDWLTVKGLANRFLEAKSALQAAGEITERTFADYRRVTDRLIDQFGRDRAVDDLRPDDFEALRASIAKTWGPVALGNEINRVRVVFKFGCDSGLLDKPMRFGPGFKRPSRKTLRRERAKKGPRMFEPADILQLLKAASPQLKAMILLAVNCGFGNSDVGGLPLSALDLSRGWANYPRPKTGIDRRCKLWPETTKAIQVVLKMARPEIKDEANKGLVFVTRCGHSWHKTFSHKTGKVMADSSVTKETRKLLDSLGIYRPGLGFYALRHTFETIGGETTDQVAVNAIMGHVDASMAGTYRERISDARLERVAEFVRAWLFGKEGVR